MRSTVMLMAVAIAAGLLVGCNKAKGPAEVAKDVNAASQAAAESNAKAEERAAQRVADARNDMRNEQRDAQHVAAVQEQKLADTDAAGDRKIALAKCEALSGDAQKACKDRAQADYDVAVAQAKQARADTDPKN